MKYSRPIGGKITLWYWQGGLPFSGNRHTRKKGIIGSQIHHEHIESAVTHIWQITQFQVDIVLLDHLKKNISRIYLEYILDIFYFVPYLVTSPRGTHTYTYTRKRGFARYRIIKANMYKLSTNRYCLVAYRLYLIDYSWISSVSLSALTHSRRQENGLQKKEVLDSRMPHHRHQASVLLSVVDCQ